MSLICKSGTKECTGCGRCREEGKALYCEICGGEIEEGAEFYRIFGKDICEDCMDAYKEVNDSEEW